MKVYWDQAKAFLEKKPILKDIIKFFLITFAIALASSVALYGILKLAGVYGTLEATLDLKHNSRIFMIPIWVAVAAAALCAIVGLLMYFHKYKRPVKKTDFTRALEPLLGKDR